MKYQVKKFVFENGDRIYITIKIDSYFAITASIVAKGCRNPYACGCCHNEIIEAYPQLKPFVDFHLRKVDGMPMHVVKQLQLPQRWQQKANELNQQIEKWLSEGFIKIADSNDKNY
jgi:hypothetical protein